jgi:lipopolysaccharide transport system ATP-binding protein
MSDSIISVENLGKKYRIKHQAEGRRYTALRDVIAEKAKGFFKKLKSGNAENLKSEAAGPISAFQDVSVSAFKGGVPGTEDFWALKDVSFEVKRGEVVGIIGRNGAGKSTLLKILSRITEPTTGRVHLRGRVASLLEVGTGFHPELTGRENIFLNGAILGMSRAEIRKKFDEIVAFAEVEKFLDTPVKRYSSGMYVRLAFAVAAHLEPEILIVDEVLAVGDAQFQKKCLGKMQDVAHEGRTVLFVSHNMAAVRLMCDKGIILSSGQMVQYSSAQEVVTTYLNVGDTNAKSSFQKGGFKISSVSFLDEYGKETVNSLTFGCAYTLLILLDCADSAKSALVVSVINDEGLKVASINSFEEGCDFWRLSSLKRIRCFIKQMRLMPGRYSLSIDLCDQNSLFLRAEQALRFTVEPQCLPNASNAYNSSHGIFRLTDAIYVE